MQHRWVRPSISTRTVCEAQEQLPGRSDRRPYLVVAKLSIWQSGRRAQFVDKVDAQGDGFAKAGAHDSESTTKRWLRSSRSAAASSRCVAATKAVEYRVACAILNGVDQCLADCRSFARLRKPCPEKPTRRLFPTASPITIAQHQQGISLTRAIFGYRVVCALSTRRHAVADKAI